MTYSRQPLALAAAATVCPPLAFAFAATSGSASYAVTQATASVALPRLCRRLWLSQLRRHR